jgi:hypothetical protein
LVAAVTLAVLVTGGAAGSAATQAADPRPLTLRLTDLPKGWAVGDDTGCGPMGIEGATPEVTKLVLELHPQVCDVEFNKLWGGSKPFYARSLAMTFEGSGGADRALSATPGMLAYFGLQGAKPSTTTVSIGDRSQIFVQPKGYPPGPQPSPETAVAWRSGEVYAFVIASARTQSDATAAAVAYAQVQQARIATPTPVSDADFDDAEVALDDPNIEVPVWWLGRSWDPPGSRPELAVFEAGAGHPRPGALPGQSVDLEYYPPLPWLPSTRGRSARIYIWRPKQWDHWRTKPYGQTAWKSVCARSETLHVAAGRAVIWSGWWKTPQTKPCPKGQPDTHFAHVYGRGYVITVNIPLCNGRRCERERSTNPYGTVAGLEAVVRALRRR